MRAAHHRWLRGSVLLAGIALSGLAAVSAHAILTRNDALTCSNQSRSSSRRAHRRLHHHDQVRPAAGQAARRRLCAARPRLSRPRRHPGRHRRFQPGHRARTRFRAGLPEPRQRLVRARQLRRGARRLRHRHQARPQGRLGLRQPRHGPARPRRDRRRAPGLSDRDRARRQSAGLRQPRPALHAPAELRRAPSPISTARCSLRPTSSDYMLRARAYEADGDLDKALADYQRAARLAARDVPRAVPAYATPSGDPNASRHRRPPRLSTPSSSPR